ncbi:unnamed protein product [marine sediment metagenome]|uniref:Transcription factor zinc-finger domain-containing protein n=1 Tax=marine sediment metagenome TaxID=412755 RepID=X1T8V3_9ZZZZ
MEKKKCPICESDKIRNSRVGDFWYLKCWGCKRMFTKNLLFELKELKEAKNGR